MKSYFLTNYFRRNNKFFLFLLLNVIFFGIFMLSGNYYHMPNDGMRDFFIIFLHWVLVCFAYFNLIYLLSLQKVIFLFAFPLVNFISAILIYYVVVFDISINSALIDSLINTNLEEAAGVVSICLIIYSTFILLSSVFFAVYRFRRRIKVSNKLFHLVLVLIGFSICVVANHIRYKTISHRVPIFGVRSIKTISE